MVRPKASRLIPRYCVYIAQLIECVFNPVCRDELECAGQNCVEGAPDQLDCFIGCFGGDWQAVVNAVDALICAERTCRGSCN